MKHTSKIGPSIPSIISGSLLLTLAIPASAVSYTYGDVLAAESTYYSPGYPEEFGMPGDDAISQASIRIGNSPQNPFDADFSVPGPVELSYTWSAPAGQRIRVQTPAGYPAPTLSFHASGGSARRQGDSFKPTQLESYTISFEGASGTILPSSAYVFLSGSVSPTMVLGFDFHVWFDLDEGENFTFESLSISTTVPASYSLSYDTTISDSYVAGQAYAPAGSASGGQWVSLEAVPEPSIAGLAALAALLGVARRRR